MKKPTIAQLEAAMDDPTVDVELRPDGEAVITPTVNYEAWAVDLCSLLDRIEMVADDPEAVKELCAGRHDIARKHGLTVELGEEVSGATH